LKFEISESCDLTVTAYVNPSGPEFSQIFTPKFREVSVKTLTHEIQLLETRLEEEKAEALSNENYELVDELEKLRTPIEELHGKALLLSLDDVTDDRYKLEDRKKEIAQKLDQLTAGKRLERSRNEYQSIKDEVTAIVSQSGEDLERRQLSELIAREHTFVNSKNPQKIEEAITQLHQISWQILQRTPAFLVDWFEHLASKQETFHNRSQAEDLMKVGKRCIATEDYDKLREVNFLLHDLLPQEEKESKEMRYFTGIS